MEFSDWITKKYIEWRGDSFGHEKTISDFAKWMGVSQSVMSYWMKKNGKVPDTQKSISKIAKRYPDIYEILELP
ncbi:MAG: hypothetical protein ABFD50_22260, partial [Smithella sp.]